MGAEMLCFPTIIGSDPVFSELDCSGLWQRTMKGHAANMLPLVCTNHIGTTTVKGNADESIIMHEFDLAQCRHPRENWGLFRDRRPAMYELLKTSDGNLI